MASDACGSRPPGPEPIAITWTQSGGASREILCEAPRLAGNECRVRVVEPVNGTYVLNASLYGEIISGAPATVVVKPAAPANRLAAIPTVPASASRLSGIVGLPADAPVPAGERLTIEAALVDAYGNPVLPDATLFYGPTATLTSVAVAATTTTTANMTSRELAAVAEAAALAAAFESVSVGLVHVGGGVYQGVAPAVTLAKGYVLTASVIVFAGSGDTEVALEPAGGAQVAVDVTPGAPDLANFLYLGSGTAPTAGAYTRPLFSST